MKIFQKLVQVFRYDKRFAHSLDIKGIYPPITTPFDLNGNLILNKLEENLKKWNQLDFRGYVVFGSNGEYKFLQELEKVEILNTVKRSTSNNKVIIVGTGCESTVETIGLTNKLASLGAHFALVINPSYYKSQMNNDSIFNYYTQIADATKIPILIYNVPLFTGIDLDAQLVVKLAQHPNIVGVKESTSNIAKISEMIDSTSSEMFDVFAGSADFLLPSLLMGASGGICASANIIGEDIIQLYKLFKSGKMNECIHLQKKLLIPNKAVTKMLGVPGLKKAMDLLGYYGGPCRTPLLHLADNQVEILKEIFIKYKYI